VVTPASRCLAGSRDRQELSPLLSNIVLDELDRELERRKHRFVRYADDCNIYVRSRQAGQRVMTSVTRFLIRRLKRKVNEAKSAVARPEERKFLGFSFSRSKEPKRRIAPKVLLRCKQKIRELMQRTRGISLEQMMKELAAYLRGWKSYFGCCQTPSLLKALEEWIRRRWRSMIWKQWKRGKQRYAELRPLGIGRVLAAQTAGSPHGPGIWRTARPLLSRFPSPTSIRWVSLACSMGMRNPLNRRTRTRIYGGVAGVDG
jgi:RNA-directed DNA polymerase